VVYFRGIFQISQYVTEKDKNNLENLTAKTLYSFEKKVRCIPGVSDIVFQFTNWRKHRGEWIPFIPEKKEKEENG